MKSTLLVLVLALTLATIPGSVAQTPADSTHLPPQLYELYSWPQLNGMWNFCLLPSPSGVNIRAETIFDKKVRLTGVAQLEHRVAELPAGTRIIWMNGRKSHPGIQEARTAIFANTQTGRALRWAQRR